MNAADELIGAFDEGADSDEIHARKGKKKEKKDDKKKSKKKDEDEKVEEEKKDEKDEKEEEEIIPEYPKYVIYCSSKFFFINLIIFRMWCSS
jgi:hypothetical protein